MQMYAGRLSSNRMPSPPVAYRDGQWCEHGEHACPDVLTCACPSQTKQAGPPAVFALLNTAAKKVRWLLQAYETLHVGDSDCHLFVQIIKGTGGTVTLSCPHGVVYVYKFLWMHETNRDHSDLLRSLPLHSAVHFMDDSCGQTVFAKGNYPDEYEEVYGSEYNGCPKPWKTGDDIDVTPVVIPELEEAMMAKARMDPKVRKHYKKIRSAKGRLRIAGHPMLVYSIPKKPTTAPGTVFRKRLCLTDRWHQGVGKKSHKRRTCQQHLTNLVRFNRS